MTGEELKLCIQFAPHVLFDKKEPFDIKHIGCTVFSGRAPSPSFPGSPLKRRIIDPVAKHAALAVESAYSYDYDIQHLYELEHVWVYIAADGTVCGCEGSFHGKYLNQMIPLFPVLDKGKTQVTLYAQPGKHAFLPSPQLFALYPEPDSCCREKAGSDGLALPEMFEDAVVLTATQQQEVTDYIRKKYAFTPSWIFEERELPSALYVPWQTLAKEIPVRIMKELRKMGVLI